MTWLGCINLTPVNCFSNFWGQKECQMPDIREKCTSIEPIKKNKTYGNKSKLTPKAIRLPIKVLSTIRETQNNKHNRHFGQGRLHVHFDPKCSYDRKEIKLSAEFIKT